jgi:membrane-bound lytic murein transglycosylase A
MTPLRRGFSIGWTGGAALVMLAVAGAPALARNPLKIPGAQYEPVGWPQIEGWADDDHDEAFATYIKSCNAILAGPPTRDGVPMQGALYNVCKKAVALNPQKPGEARLFFEQNFKPFRISPLGNPDGFVTGYYEPIVQGLQEKADGYDYPLYRKPPNLLPGGHMAVTKAAAATDDEAGKKKKKRHGLLRRLVSFFDRSSIEDGALAGRNLEICWLKDPVDSFFAQIQGSVRVQLDDGRLMRLNYDAANGHPYYAIGRDLIARNIISKDEMSMDRIREWIARNPESGRELMRKNKSYVFFRETRLSSNDEPVGAEGISLTPGRSIAVDRKLHTYGTPFFISGYLPIEGLKPDTWFRRLMIAQDTGGAIVGPARADLYFGAGDEAESVAGRMRHNASFVMLLPRELDPSKATDDEIPLPRPRPSDLEVPVANAPSEPTPEATATIVPPPKAAVVALPPAKPAALKPAEKLAAKSVAAAPDKKAEPKLQNKTGIKLASKPADPAPEKKADKKPEKKADKKKPEKTASKTEAWESRVMPVIKPDTPEQKPKHKKKG